MNPNRLRYWRKRRGLTQQALAKAMETEQATISRIEKGEQDFSLDWMTRAATALKLSHPVLLWPWSLLGGFQDDVGVDQAASEMIGLGQSGVSTYRVLTDVLHSANIRRGDVLLVSHQTDNEPINLSRIPSGTVVIAQVDSISETGSGLIMRKFLEPDLLCANGLGSPINVSLDDPDLEVRIVGTMLRYWRGEEEAPDASQSPEQVSKEALRKRSKK